jgi:hypothetical protein
MEPLSNLSCGLEIAGLGLRVHTDDPEVEQGLAQRYRSFPLRHTPRLILAIHCAGRERSEAPPEASFWEGQLFFTAAGYTGYVDISRGWGELSLSSAWPVADADYFIRGAFALLAFVEGGLLLHAAGVVREDHAYLFLGHSGAGKSTVACLSPSARLLNDDLVLLWPADGGWWACATPFGNPSSPMTSPGRALVRVLLGLVQDREVRLEKVRPGVAVAEVVGNAPIVSLVPGWTEVLLARCQQILQAAPYYRLHFLPDDSFWRILNDEPDMADGTPGGGGGSGG